MRGLYWPLRFYYCGVAVAAVRLGAAENACFAWAGKVVGAHEPYHFVTLALGAIVAEEDNGRRTEYPEASQERLIRLIVGRDVRLQQHGVRERVLDAAVGERVLLHFLAGHAPVGVEIQHRGLSRARRAGERPIQVVHRLDAHELQFMFFDGGRSTDGDPSQRLQGIVATRHRTE